MRSATGIGQARSKQFLHKESGSSRDGFIGVHLLHIVVNHFFFSVRVGFHNACNEHGVDVLAIISHGAISIHHFQQIHIHRAQAHGRLIFVSIIGAQGRFDAHRFGSGSHIAESHTLAHTHRHNVDASCKCFSETHLIAGAIAIGIMGRIVFHHAFVFVVDIPVKHLIQFRVAWGESLFHSSGIDKEFESRARLPH